jgi:hypothetical protein
LNASVFAEPLDILDHINNIVETIDIEIDRLRFTIIVSEFDESFAIAINLESHVNEFLRKLSCREFRHINRFNSDVNAVLTGCQLLADDYRSSNSQSNFCPGLDLRLMVLLELLD